MTSTDNGEQAAVRRGRGTNRGSGGDLGSFGGELGVRALMRRITAHGHSGGRNETPGTREDTGKGTTRGTEGRCGRGSRQLIIDTADS